MLVREVKGKGVPLRAKQALRGGTALHLLDPGTRRGWWPAPRLGRFTPGKRDQVPTAQEAAWASGPVWMGPENIAPPGFEPSSP